MLKGFFKPQTKAKIKLNDILRGKKTNFRAVGCLVFSMKEDGVKYFWEEWELLGLENYDSWVEYDHYSREVSIYEPVRITEKIDPENLEIGKYYKLDFDKTGKNSPIEAMVWEVGTGTIERIIGKNTYQVFEGEKMLYAVLTNYEKEFSIEKYNNREYDIYLKRKLSTREQKEIFGRKLSPFNWSLLGIILFCIALGWMLFFTPSSSEKCTTDAYGHTTCKTIRSRGIYGGGGGGIGK